MPSVDVQPDESGSKPVNLEEAPKSYRALSRLKRELSDDELSSPGVQKLLLDLLAQAEDEVTALKSFREQYHAADKLNGLLGEKLRTKSAAKVISMGCFAVGGAAVGYAPGLLSSSQATQFPGVIALIFGVALIAVGIWAEVLRQ